MSNEMDDYVVCIPSYKRSKICNDQTLTTLKNNGIKPEKINVYVANKEEYEEYKNLLNKELYNKLIIGKKGLVKQKEFIMESWKDGKHIVFLDDDITAIDFSLSPIFKGHNFDYFIKYAFKECIKHGSYIWGVYAVYNPFFRKTKKEMVTELNFIVGAFYGIINRPKLKSLKLNITTKENDQKEDVERTIKYYINDGIVLRFNKVGFVTKYYGNEGGMGNFEERVKYSEGISKRLKEKYPEYGDIKVRKNGVYEIVLKKNPHKTQSIKSKKENKNKTRKIKHEK